MGFIIKTVFYVVMTLFTAELSSSSICWVHFFVFLDHFCLPWSFLFSFALAPLFLPPPHLVSVACCLLQSGRSGPAPTPTHSKSLKFLPTQFCTWADPQVVFLCHFSLCLSVLSALGGHPPCGCLALLRLGALCFTVFQRRLLLFFSPLLSALPEVSASWISQRSLHTPEEPDAQINEAAY